MTKTSLILEHLRAHKGITSFEAFDLYGATRLASIIHGLRKKGYDIETVDRVAKDRYGNTVRFAEYQLERGAKC